MYIYVYYVCVCVCLWYNITYLYIYVTVMLRIRGMLSNVSEQNPFCTQRRIWESPSPFSSGQLARQLFCHSSDFTAQIIQHFSVKIDIKTHIGYHHLQMYAYVSGCMCGYTYKSTHTRSSKKWTGVRKLNICFRVRVFGHPWWLEQCQWCQLREKNKK